MTDVPTEFRLFPLGQIKTEKGDFLLTPKDAQACMKAWKAYGNELSIDYEHGVFLDDGLPKPAAGWFKLALRPDGLWAVGIHWNKKALSMLMEKEYRYYSPAFLSDEDGHITKIINCALTNIPATHNLTPIVTARDKAFAVYLGKGKARAIHGKPCVLAIGDKYADGPANQSANRVKAMGKLSKKMAAAAGAAVAKALEELDADGDDAESMDDSADDAPPAGGGAGSTELDDDGSDGGDAVAADETLDEDASELDDDGDDDAVAAAAPKAPMMKAKAKALKPPFDAGKASRKLSVDILSVAREVTGKVDPSEVAGALRALKASKTHIERLSARIDELESERTEMRVKSVVSKAMKAGKISPAEKDWAVKLGLADLAQLNSYIEVTPTKVTTAQTARRSHEGAATLSADEEKMITLTGVKREDYLARKAAGLKNPFEGEKLNNGCSYRRALRPEDG